MIYRALRVALVSMLVVVLLLPFSYACGPDFTGPIFTAVSGPESADVASYGRGNLGILQTTYWHEPLYIAYRNLSGQPFTASEIRALGQPSEEQNVNATDWVAMWKQARQKIVGPEGEPPMFNAGHGITRQLDQPDTFVSYYNCLDGAFQNAVEILRKRSEQFGAQSPMVKDWTAAQDRVFENCSGGSGFPPQPKEAVIPAAAHAQDPAEIRADRAYQIAAAHFYASDLDAAQTAFEAIAQDASSPYHELAEYLIARVLVRRGTLFAEDGPRAHDALVQAEAQLRKILTDGDLQAMHPAAQRLLGFVNIRLHRQQRFHQLETSLARPSDAPTFRQDLTDYLWLLDHPVLLKTVTLPAGGPGKMPRQDTQADESTRLAGADMTDWIFTFQSGEYAHALQRWRETKCIPWLVAAIAKAPANDPPSRDLLAAADKIAPGSPAFATVSFHRLRLMSQSGDADAARVQLDQLLAGKADLPRGSRNQFVALRAKLATSLEDFLKFAPRASSESSDVSNDANHQTPKDIPRFDADASVIFTEKLPLGLLAASAKSTVLAASLRREVAVAAWTRAILSNDDAVAQELLPAVEELVPEVKDDLTSYASASDVSSRQFAAVFAMLRNPGFRPFVTAGYPRGNLYTIGEPRFDRIDNLRDNWWCSAAPGTNENTFIGEDYYRMFVRPSVALFAIYPDGISNPAFLSIEQRAAADQQHSELAAQPAAPNWLGKRALDWANAHPDDPRVPEALHLVVRARRYGCADATSDNYSKAAFALLHKRYPQSEWARKTPYWFE